MWKILIASMSAFILTVGDRAYAATAMYAGVPTAWRLENYSGGDVTAHTMGTTSCARIYIDASWTGDDRNRFWATIMTGKVANRRIFVFFDDVTCKLVSFGFIEG